MLRKTNPGQGIQEKQLKNCLANEETQPLLTVLSDTPLRESNTPTPQEVENTTVVNPVYAHR